MASSAEQSEMDKSDVLAAMDALVKTEERLKVEAKQFLDGKNSLEDFLGNNIKHLFGLTITYKKTFDRFGVKTKEELEKMVKKYYRYPEVQELMDRWLHAEREWDGFMDSLDKQLLKEAGPSCKLGERGPLDCPLVDAHTGETTTLQAHCGRPTVLVLLRHFA